ncbi:MAG: tol-pal system YbgF family protein [Gemmatimonadales bacterium]
MSRRLVAACSVLLLAGCTYFNGMYNARRLAGEATKADSKGRTFEANRLWGLAGIKAESVIVQHPKSKYVPEAMAIRATSFERANECNDAVPLAQHALTTTTDPKVLDRASLALGRCYDRMGDQGAATAAFDRLLTSTQATIRSEALYRHGRSLRSESRFDQAMAELSQSKDPRAMGERAAALLGVGRVDAGLVVVDSLLVRPDSTAPWSDILTLYAGADPGGATALVSRLADDKRFPVDSRVRWLIEDGQRLADYAPSQAEARFQQAITLGGTSAGARDARAASLRFQLSQLSTPAELPPVIEHLGDLGEGMTGGQAVARYLAAARLVAAAADSQLVSRPQGDMRLFVGAEVARDSLGAPRLAQWLLSDLVTHWPESPYAPKALLSLAMLSPDSADRYREELENRYSNSPYLAVTRGADPPAYQHLEDSLWTFSQTMRVNIPRTRPSRPGVKPTPRDAGDNDR